MLRKIWFLPALALIAIWCIANPAIAADHRDGPRFTPSPGFVPMVQLDLNDLYAFVSPSNPNNTVLVLTTGGLNIGPSSPPFFAAGAVYEIRVSNDGVKTDDELVFQFVFSNPDRFGRQNYKGFLIERKAGRGAGRGRPGPREIIDRAVTGQRVTGQLGIRVQAGIFDDPFFFNSPGFNRYRAATIAGASIPDRLAAFGLLEPVNAFNGNTLAIVMELPRLQLQSHPNNPNITIWLRALLPNGQQFDRTGLPAINTATLFQLPLAPPPIIPDNLQDFFNDRIPAGDADLIEQAALRINHIWGLSLTNAPTGLPNARQLAAVVLPDVMPFNTTNSGGFLNGRRLADDVIDAELNLLTGGVVTSDGVANDSVFLNQFPYLGGAKPPQ